MKAASCDSAVFRWGAAGLIQCCHVAIEDGCNAGPSGHTVHCSLSKHLLTTGKYTCKCWEDGSLDET